MKTKSYSGYIIGGVILLFAIWLISTYNGMVNKDEKVKLQWNEVENTYQRRLDLIPNIINVVKGGADYEQTTLRKIIEARAKAASVNVGSGVSAAQYNRMNEAQDSLAGAANRLLVTVEKYPDIKGTKTFSNLQSQLEGTERRIKIARKDFNAAVADYNSSVKSFPTKLAAAIFSFHPKDGFASDAGADKAVEIKF